MQWHVQDVPHTNSEGHLEGDFRSVFQALHQKRQLRLSGQSHQHIRPLLLILGGSLRGVYGGGQITALTDAGLQHAFDTVVGLSTGAPACAYLLAGQAALGTSIYYDECVDRPLFRFSRLLHGEPVADIPFLTRVFRGEISTKGLDQAAVRTCPTKLLIGVTEAETGAQRFVDGKTATPDIVAALAASVSIPLLAPRISLDGVPVTDGGVAHPFPLRSLIERCRPTHVLVLPNITEGEACRPVKDAYFLGVSLYNRLLPRPLRSRLECHAALFSAELAWVRSNARAHEFAWTIAWPGGTIGGMSTDRIALKDAAELARKQLFRALVDAGRANRPGARKSVVTFTDAR